MGLKIANNFTVTNRFGGVENYYLTWYEIAKANINEGGEIVFAISENETEALRRNYKGFLRMDVPPQKILEMFAQTGIVALKVSDTSWQLAQTIKFIPDHAWVEAQKAYVPTLKSLTDLNATIVDIGNPFG